ncbi:MAG: hypothetical protein WCE61_05145 [Candidatus Acidiferrum sp.]
MTVPYPDSYGAARFPLADAQEVLVGDRRWYCYYRDLHLCSVMASP